MMYSKDDFETMIDDWRADGSPEYDDLIVEDPEIIDGKWIAYAHDEKNGYELSDDGTGNIIINYAGSL